MKKSSKYQLHIILFKTLKDLIQNQWHTTDDVRFMRLIHKSGDKLNQYIFLVYHNALVFLSECHDLLYKILQICLTFAFQTAIRCEQNSLKAVFVESQRQFLILLSAIHKLILSCSSRKISLSTTDYLYHLPKNETNSTCYKDSCYITEKAQVLISIYKKDQSY